MKGHTMITTAKISMRMLAKKQDVDKIELAIATSLDEHWIVFGHESHGPLDGRLHVNVLVAAPRNELNVDAAAIDAAVEAADIHGYTLGVNLTILGELTPGGY